MKRLVPLVLAAISLSGCAAFKDPQFGKLVLDDLKGCDRHYELIFGSGQVGGAVNGSAKVDCKAIAQASDATNLPPLTSNLTSGPE